MFQIELVDANISANLSNPPVSYSNDSNNAGLNQIFVNYNVQYYTQVYGFSSDGLFDKMGIIECSSCDPSLLVQDLLAYTSVIQYAVATGDLLLYFFYNALQRGLEPDSIGSYSSTENAVVVANNNEFNQVFEDHSVRVYNAMDSLTDIAKALICDGNAQLLKQELDNVTGVINYTENIYYTELLSIFEESLNTSEIYPNPF